MQLGQALGRFAIEIDFAGSPGPPVCVTVEAAHVPEILSVLPAGARTEDQITIQGRYFGSLSSGNDVRIDGVRALVTSASPTQLRVQVPRCLTSGPTQITIRRGSLQSEPAALEVTGTTVQQVNLRAGEVLLDAGHAACLRLAPNTASARYIVIPVNAAGEGEPAAGFQVSGTNGDLVARMWTARLSGGSTRDVGAEFEARLRRQEAALLSRAQARPRPRERVQARVRIPELGDARDFNVIAPWYGWVQVRASARGLGRHVIIYVDERAPVISDDYLAGLVQTFDDLIYPTDVDVFGEPSDVDGNGRVAVLLSPAVNRLTPAGSNGFIAGFFYGCDLLDRLDCEESNGGEVLYTVTPDPNGMFGIRHTEASIQRLLPAVIVHELAHAIHFNQRVLVNQQFDFDALWLAEALAHSAEDTLAGVLHSRGDSAGARDMAYQNYLRASLFLTAPERTSLVPIVGFGTLEERGAGWLFLKYLRARTNPDVMRRLTNGRRFGSQNVTQVTGLEWPSLLGDWATAMYAAASIDVNGSRLAQHTFGSFDLAAAIKSVSDGRYPLEPRQPRSARFTLELMLPPSAATYLQLEVPAAESFSLSLRGERGHDFHTSARPAIAILRIE
ncbi:MAG: IPT/TIG domain-containing protein [Longimicrobiales bacterium]